jgi:transposase
MAEPERDARSLSPDGQEAVRVRGVKLLLEGWTQVAVADALGVGERQVAAGASATSEEAGRRWRSANGGGTPSRR